VLDVLYCVKVVVMNRWLLCVKRYLRSSYREQGSVGSVVWSTTDASFIWKELYVQDNNRILIMLRAKIISYLKLMGHQI